jgi:hypothetical protein
MYQHARLEAETLCPVLSPCPVGATAAVVVYPLASLASYIVMIFPISASARIVITADFSGSEVASQYLKTN